MAEAFLTLSQKDRLEALGVAATASGRPEHLLEKDIWVVWALSTLFKSEFADKLVFKGGTSLSKAYKAIRRFSEDIDVTYDIRALAPDIVGEANEALPANASQEQRWTRQIKERLPIFVANKILPIIRTQLTRSGISAEGRAEGEKIHIRYNALTQGSGYVSPEVLIEFGARSTGEPFNARSIVCDAAEYLPQLTFPRASVRVMNAERTFWEKATAIHVYCLRGKFRGERFARHWHDLTRLDRAGFVAPALADRDLANAVARHKALFFAENDSLGARIDYHAAVNGSLKLVPAGKARQALETDYEAMASDGVLLDDAEPFSAVLEACLQIQNRANAPRPSK